MTGLMARKAAMRKEAFARRKVAHDACAASGTGVTDRLQEVIAARRGAVVAGYMAMRSEIDPTPVMERLAKDTTVCVPVIVAPGQPLRFAKWEPECAMQDGAFGARIPAELDYVVPDVLIVPLVAFSREGGRLGYGGGFYDRTLEALRASRPTFAIGFAYAAQEFADIPLEPTDQSLDLLVTEREIIRPSKR